MPTKIPNVFVSYSHDSQTHKDWVRLISERLIKQGVEIILDAYDLRPGQDIYRFMEQGVTTADRIIVVCSKDYVEKAEKREGGVGYENLILVPEITSKIDERKILPIIRNNDSQKLTPKFLKTLVYIDFRNDKDYEEKYDQLLREIHEVPLFVRPKLGTNPFDNNAEEQFEISQSSKPTLGYSPFAVQTDTVPIGSIDDSNNNEQVLELNKVIDFPSIYIEQSTHGKIVFDYSKNNGRFTLGEGHLLFETMWSRANQYCIHVYNDPKSISKIAIASEAKTFSLIEDASQYDMSSRYQTPKVNEIVIWVNSSGYFLATKILNIKSHLHGSVSDEVTFSYVISREYGADFRSMLIAEGYILPSKMSDVV